MKKQKVKKNVKNVKIPFQLIKENAKTNMPSQDNRLLLELTAIAILNDDLALKQKAGNF